MLTECPHCFTRVLPRPDGECPSCQQNTRDVRDADGEITTVIVRENSRMPDYRCTCMLPERRLVRVARSRLVWGRGRDTSFGAAAAFALQLFVGGLHMRLCEPSQNVLPRAHASSSSESIRRIDRTTTVWSSSCTRYGTCSGSIRRILIERARVSPRRTGSILRVGSIASAAAATA
jgi:hypothetical protein